MRALIRWAVPALLSMVVVTTNANPILCPRVASTDMSMELDSIDPNGKGWRFNEISGLVFSPSLTGPSGEPLFYAVNDASGTRIGVWDSGTGQRIRTYHILGLPSSQDRESMTGGSCGVDGEDEYCLYIADAGDNTARDSSGQRTGRPDFPYRILKIKELNVTEFADNATIPASYTSILNYNYLHPTSPSTYADCEAVFLDNVGFGGGAKGDLYIIPKWNNRDADEMNRLFKIPAEAWSAVGTDVNYTYSPAAVGYYGNGTSSNALMGKIWTRAEMTLDGTLIAIGDYSDQFLFLRCPGMSVEEAITGQGVSSCESWPIQYGDSQFETIAWTPNGTVTLEISEGRNPPMAWTTFNYTYDPGLSVACPDPMTAVPTKAPSLSPATAPSQVPLASLSTPGPTLVPSEAASSLAPQRMGVFVSFLLLLASFVTVL